MEKFVNLSNEDPTINHPELIFFFFLLSIELNSEYATCILFELKSVAHRQKQAEKRTEGFMKNLEEFKKKTSTLKNNLHGKFDQR